MSGYPIYPPKPVWFDQNGDPLTGGSVEVFLSGTSNHADIFTDIELTTPADNPFTLNSRGEPATAIYAAYAIPLKVEVRDALDALVYTVDPYFLITGSGGVAFATPAETDAGEISTKAVHPFGGAYAFDRLRHPNQHTAGKGTAAYVLPIAAGIATPNCTESNVFRLSLTENCTLANPTDPFSGQVINIIIKQDATGGRTLALGNKYKFAGGTAPTVSAGANARDLLSCQYDVSDDVWLCAYQKGFA